MNQNSKNNQNNKFYWIYGKHPVAEVLNNPNRKILEIAYSKKEILDEVRANSKHKNIPLKTCSNHDLEKLINQPLSVHQGIAIKVMPIFKNNFNEKLAELNKRPKAKIAILDQITDPHNVGAIIRSAAAFGVDAILLPKDNSPVESGTIAKSSAGILEKLDIFSIISINNTIKDLKDNNFWVIGLDGSTKTSINEMPKYDKIAIVLGSEGEGIRKLVKTNCDLLVKIPMQNSVESLNVSNAAAITFFTLNH
jgi:23S rRNA (guanosine2251-2'-O)-methyltransferase